MDRPSFAVTVRLPSRTEYWYTENLPQPGTTMSYCGGTYLVVSCEEVDGSGYVLRLAEPEPEPAPSEFVEPLPA
jgi:hypothetical protein